LTEGEAFPAFLLASAAGTLPEYRIPPNREKPLIINDNKTIKFWLWADAPEYYKAFSENGGDEDWICFIPDALLKEGNWFPQFEQGAYNPDVDQYDVPGGQIRICSHA
jgi:hypothetical protein